MKHLKFTKKHITAIAIVAFLFTACSKVDNPDPVGTNGQTLIKIIGGGQTDYTNGGAPGVMALHINFVPVAQSLTLADIRRDISNASALNTAMNVTVKDDTTALRVYSDSLIAQGSAIAPIVYLPSSFYSLGAGVTKTGADGGNYNLAFAPGDFAKQIRITLPDATVLDPSSKYGLAFTITSVNANGTISSSRTLIVTISANNLFDGVYSLNFRNYHPVSNTGYTGAVVNVEMWTTGPNTVKIYMPDFAAYANPSILNGSLSAFAGQEPEYTIDPVTNAVTVQNTAAGAVTFYSMSPVFNSYYDPASKSIHTKWGYNYVGGVFTLGQSREWTQDFGFIGPR